MGARPETEAPNAMNAMNLRAFFGVTCGVLLLIVVVVYIDGAENSAADVTTLMQLMNSTGLLSPNPKSAAKNKLSALDLKRINVNGPAMVRYWTE